jgi:hypothetical protein
MLTSINSATLLSESRQAPHRKCESAIPWTGIMRNYAALNVVILALLAHLLLGYN